MSTVLNPYLLLTPGPLSTSASVKETMLRDWCTWDDDYNRDVVQNIRARLVSLATAASGYSAVLMQGSGTFAVEAAIGSMMPREGGRLLVCINGAYGERIASIAARLAIPFTPLAFEETVPVSAAAVHDALVSDPSITHVALVHCETTTGMLNPLEAVCAAVRANNRQLMVDAMSSFGGIPIDVDALGIDVIVSSSNKCIQGVPGFGFVIAKSENLARWNGNARSLSLDIYDQWNTMERQGGKWRFTSPTHVVRAFQQALNELDIEGGVAARHERYVTNQRLLVDGMESLGFAPLLPRSLHSPIITTFCNPDSPGYSFFEFYERLKVQGFVIYPGKVSHAECFRIGTIGEVYPRDIEKLVAAVERSMCWLG